VLQHCVKWLKAHENYWPDFVILLYPTAPFLKKQRIEEAIDLFEKSGCNSIIGVVKDWGRFWKQGSDGVYTPLHPEQRVNRQYYQPLYREDGSIYFSKPEVYTEMDKLVDENNIQFIEMEPDENVDIDNPSDLKKAQQKKI
jgi:N-acylneuraminate cytidylyltransferase